MKIQTLLFFLVLSFSIPIAHLQEEPVISSDPFESFSDKSKLILSHALFIRDEELGKIFRLHSKIYAVEDAPVAPVLGWKMMEVNGRPFNKVFFKNVVSISPNMNGMIPFFFSSAVLILEYLKSIDFVCPFDLEEDSFVYDPLQRKFLLGNFANAYCEEKDPNFFETMMNRLVQKYDIFHHREANPDYAKFKTYSELLTSLRNKSLKDLDEFYALKLALQIFDFNPEMESSRANAYKRKVSATQTENLQKGSSSLKIEHLLDDDLSTLALTVGNTERYVKLPENTGFFVFICEEMRKDSVSNCVDVRLFPETSKESFSIPFSGDQLIVEEIEYRVPSFSQSQRSFIEIYISPLPTDRRNSIIFDLKLIDLTLEGSFHEQAEYIVYCKNSVNKHALLRFKHFTLVQEEEIELEMDYKLPKGLKGNRIPAHPGLADSIFCSDRFKELYTIPLGSDQGLYFKSQKKESLSSSIEKSQSDDKSPSVDKSPSIEKSRSAENLLSTEKSPLIDKTQYVVPITKKGLVPPIFTTDCPSNVKRRDQFCIYNLMNSFRLRDKMDFSFVYPLVFLQNRVEDVSMNTCLRNSNGSSLTQALLTSHNTLEKGCLNFNSHQLQKTEKYLMKTIIYEPKPNNSCFPSRFFTFSMPEKPTIFFRIQVISEADDKHFLMYIVYKYKAEPKFVHMTPKGLRFGYIPKFFKYPSATKGGDETVDFLHMSVYYLDSEEVVYGMESPVEVGSKFHFKVAIDRYRASTVELSYPIFGDKLYEYPAQDLDEMDNVYGLRIAIEIFEARANVVKDSFEDEEQQQKEEYFLEKHVII